MAENWYRVLIRCNATGEERWSFVDWNWFYGASGDEYREDGDRYWWTDGNFGCDCNRHLEFERANGGDPDVMDPSIVCGSDSYAAICAELPDGTRIEIDGRA